jgi:pantothenate kinase type III
MVRIRGVTAADELDGGAVLPGFRIPVAALFPEAAGGEAAPQ